MSKAKQPTDNLKYFTNAELREEILDMVGVEYGESFSYNNKNSSRKFKNEEREAIVKSLLHSKNKISKGAEFLDNAIEYRLYKYNTADINVVICNLCDLDTDAMNGRHFNRDQLKVIYRELEQ